MDFLRALGSVFRFVGSVLRFLWELEHWRFSVCAYTGAICLLLEAIYLPAGFGRNAAFVATLVVFLLLGMCWDRNTPP